MFRFRFFRFFYDIFWKKYSSTKRSHHFIATNIFLSHGAAPPATSGSCQFVIPSEGSTIFLASGSTCTDPWGWFQVIQLMTPEKNHRVTWRVTSPTTFKRVTFSTHPSPKKINTIAAKTARSETPFQVSFHLGGED